jgi:RNA polymerase sigma-70 factor, ECF subfamily
MLFAIRGISSTGRVVESRCEGEERLQQPDHATPGSVDDAPEDLMGGYKAGCAVSADALVRRVSPALLRFFLADAVSRTHADDLLQETWLRIHRVRHTYRFGEPVMPWFYAIARRVRIDHYRRARRSTLREETVEDFSGIASADSESSSLADMDELLAPLSPHEREVVQMLKVIGMSLDEVARATSCSVGSVKQKAHRAYQKLRKVPVRETARSVLP